MRASGPAGAPPLPNPGPRETGLAPRHVTRPEGAVGAAPAVQSGAGVPPERGARRAGRRGGGAVRGRPVRGRRSTGHRPSRVSSECTSRREPVEPRRLLPALKGFCRKNSSAPKSGCKRKARLWAHSARARHLSPRASHSATTTLTRVHGRGRHRPRAAPLGRGAALDPLSRVDRTPTLGQKGSESEGKR